MLVSQKERPYGHSHPRTAARDPEGRRGAGSARRSRDTNQYVILKADVYDRIRALADETRAAYPLAMKIFGQDGWDDPQMDEYNLLDPRR